MSTQTVQKSQPQLDLSDVEPRVGQLVGGGQLWGQVRMTNQDGVVLVDGLAELE